MTRRFVLASPQQPSGASFLPPQDARPQRDVAIVSAELLPTADVVVRLSAVTAVVAAGRPAAAVSAAWRPAAAIAVAGRPAAAVAAAGVAMAATRAAATPAAVAVHRAVVFVARHRLAADGAACRRS